jgi:hypothetical protein
VSPDYAKPNNNGVSSLATLPPLKVGSPLQFRFVGAVRDPNFCPDTLLEGPIWDVNKFLIKGVEISPHPCPEPAHRAEAVLLAGLGLELVRRLRRSAAAGTAPAGSEPARA